jgi:hypothetical protein
LPEILPEDDKQLIADTQMFVKLNMQWFIIAPYKSLKFIFDKGYLKGS